MLISYNWLQTYFKDTLPSPKDLGDLLTMHIFEIEGVTETQSGAHADDTAGHKDAILDVKVLPDRTPYCLSHRYVAQEIGAILDTTVDFPSIEEFTTTDAKQMEHSLTIQLSPEVLEKKLCTRYIGRIIEHVNIEPSPDWLKNQLEVLGQRSINTIVDLTNYVMLETGQPLHAFDADKVEGSIQVRMAVEGEEISLLDGTEEGQSKKLDASMLVIADDIGPLAIAGVKGGKRAGITEDTKNILLESACFDSALVRKTSQKIGIRNDSSKRFENGVTPERAGLALSMVTGHITNMNANRTDADTTNTTDATGTKVKIGDLKIGEAIDIYPNPVGDRQIQVQYSKIIERLGISISLDDVVKILTRCGLAVVLNEEDESLNINIPPYRSDLQIREDIVDEVGRIHGYEHISNSDLNNTIEKAIKPSGVNGRTINKNFYYSNLIRQKLASIGFSEVLTYSLVHHGDIPLENPLTSERACMRNTISDLLAGKFLFNMKNVDLLGIKEVRIFEIGAVFSEKRERKSLAFGIARSKQLKGVDAKQELVEIIQSIFRPAEVSVTSLTSATSEALLTPSAPSVLAISETFIEKIKYKEIKGDAQTPCTGLIAEIDLDDVIEYFEKNSAERTTEHATEFAIFQIGTRSTAKYVPISIYPFSVRDIAVFVPGEPNTVSDLESDVKSEVEALIRSTVDKYSQNENLLARLTLFDVFTKKKEGEPTRTSYAYRLVLQSKMRTLTEEEVHSMMEKITVELAKKEGFEVR